MRHVTVFSDPNTYAGWPANHGAWQWGNEFLVGFMLGGFDHAGIGNGMHAIKQPYRKVLSRSLDGGETWNIEVPNVDFVGVNPTEPPPFNLGESIIRVCGNYDTGGDDNPPLGGAFYLSRDRGHVWEGPFKFYGLEQCWSDGVYWNTSRTCVLGDRVFLSAARRDQWGSDFVMEVLHHGLDFEMVNVVLQDKRRAVMPAAAMIGDTTFVAMRRKGAGRNWIDLCVQMHLGQEWMNSGFVMDTGSHNGNPPALVAVGDTLVCAAGDRLNKVVKVFTSRNFGGDWKNHRALRSGLTVDIGYPRLFTRSDGKLVCVYYYADAPDQAQRIEATIFDP